MTAKQILEELRGDTPKRTFASQLGITPRMLTHIYKGTRHIGEKTIRGLVEAYPQRKDELLAIFLSRNGNNSPTTGTN